MPTKTSVPVNFSDMSNTNITKIRSGAKWKGFGAFTKYQCQTQNGYFSQAGCPPTDTECWNCVPDVTGPKGPSRNTVKIFPKKYNIAGMYKPFVNYQSGKGPNNGSIGFKDQRKDCLTSTKALNPGENLAYPGTGEPYGGNSSNINVKRADSNAFRARPMKHYRLQYGNDNNKQTYNNRYLLNAFNKPGGVILKSYNGMIPKIVQYNGVDVKLDQAWVENQAAYNVIKYGKDRELYSFPTPGCDGDSTNWQKLIKAGVDKNDIVKYGLYSSSLFNDSTRSLMKGLGAAIRAYPDYTLGKFNKVGKYNPIYFSTNDEDSKNNPELIASDDNYTPNASWACNNCPNFQCKEGKKDAICASGNKTCVNICDPPTKAKQRVRTSSRINNPVLCQKPYYFSNSSYLRSRCKTFKQNEFHYDSKADPSIGLPDPNAPCADKKGCCGRSAACSKAYRTSCPSKKDVADCKGNIVDCQKATYYKPNNCQFSQQGGVSSSSRLLRLKLNTINSSANSVNKAYGKSTASALSYSGRPEAPFVNKDKMNAGGYIKKKDYGWIIPILDHNGNIISYAPSTQGEEVKIKDDKGNTKQILRARKVLKKMPCDDNLYFLYRPGGGNPVTHVMNGIGQGGAMTQRIIGRFNSTSEYPDFNQDSNSSPQRFWFMSRQDKTVNRARERNTKVLM